MNPGWRKNYLRYKSYFLNISQSYQERTDIKVYLEILLSLVTIIMFSIFALRPTLLTITQLIKEIETKKELIVKINKKLQDVASAQNIHNQNLAKIQLLDTAIAPQPTIEILARQMEGLLAKHSISMVNLTASKTTIFGAGVEATPKHLTPLPEDSSGLIFSLGLEADLEEYPKLFGYLLDFENLRIPLKIDTLSVTTTNVKEENKHNLLLTIGGRLPYLKKSE